MRRVLAGLIAWLCDSAMVGGLAGFLYWLLMAPGPGSPSIRDVLILYALPGGAIMGAYFFFLSGLQTPGRRVVAHFIKAHGLSEPVS